MSAAYSRCSSILIVIFTPWCWHPCNGFVVVFRSLRVLDVACCLYDTRHGEENRTTHTMHKIARGAVVLYFPRCSSTTLSNPWKCSYERTGADGISLLQLHTKEDQGKPKTYEIRSATHLTTKATATCVQRTGLVSLLRASMGASPWHFLYKILRTKMQREYTVIILGSNSMTFA